MTDEDHNMIRCPKCYIWRPKEIKECEHCTRMYGTGLKGNKKLDRPPSLLDRRLYSKFAQLFLKKFGKKR